MKNITLVALLVFSTSICATEYLVKLKSGASLTKGAFQVQSSFTLSYGDFAVIDLDESQVKSVQSLPEIEYIEPNHTLRAFEIEDRKFRRQWGLENTGRNSGNIFFPGIKGTDIKALEAWGITTGDRNVKIAVIDTGVDYNHEDLKDNIMINERELNGEEGVDDDGNGYVDDIYGYDFANDDNDPMDGHGHGTHCAGVIGASHNDIGVRGVMSKVQILPIQFLAKDGSGKLEGAVKSIDYAVSRGVDIMSNSWGGNTTSKAIEEAVARAQEAGILFIAAAGNSRSDNDSKDVTPATIKLDNVVAVGAMDGRGKKANFSNYGKNSVHVFAPGVNIYSTVTKNKYKKMSGTSMACPMVAGVAGLLLANEPNLTYLELKSRLMSYTQAGDDLSKYSMSGYIDAFAALENK